MKSNQSAPRAASESDVRLSELREPLLCALPDFIKIPAIPGLPTELTGAALREAIQQRAEAGVSVRRP